MKRILLKISGEALKGEKEFGIDPSYVEKLVEKISLLHSGNYEIAIVVGGGNIYRGSNLIASGVSAPDSHSLSMLSTVFNGVVLENFLKKSGINAKTLNPLSINFLEVYNKNNAKKYLEEGQIVVLVGGTGNPFFTTDTGGVLRALELDCDLMIKATKVDGIYDKDPMKYEDAQFFSEISYAEVLEKNLKILDQTAVSLARDGKLQIQVINIADIEKLLDEESAEEIGSIIS